MVNSHRLIVDMQRLAMSCANRVRANRYYIGSTFTRVNISIHLGCTGINVHVQFCNERTLTDDTVQHFHGRCIQAPGQTVAKNRFFVLNFLIIKFQIVYSKIVTPVYIFQKCSMCLKDTAKNIEHQAYLMTVINGANTQIELCHFA